MSEKDRKDEIEALENKIKELEKEAQRLREDVEEDSDEEEEKIDIIEKLERESARLKEEKRKKQIIIGIIIVFVIIFLVAFLLLIGVFKKDKSDNTNSNNTKDDKEKSSSETIKKVNYGVVDGALYLNQYVYKDKVLTNLFQEKVTKIENGYSLREGLQSLYAISNGDSNQLVVKKFIGNNFKTILEKKKVNSNYSGAIVDMSGHLLGMYDNSKEDGILYMLGDNSFNEISLSNKGLFGYASSSFVDRYVYENKYIITYDKKYSSGSGKDDLVGLYDISSKKELLKPIYKILYYIGDSKFIAKKDNKVGIIDVNGKILLDFRYPFIEKTGNYYIVGNSEGIVVLDSNYKEISETLNIGKVDDYRYYLCCGDTNYFTGIVFNNHLIIRVGDLRESDNLDYYYLDGKEFKKLVTGQMRKIDDYLITQSVNSNILSIYNKNLDVVREYDFGTNIKEWSAYQFLKDYFVFVKSYNNDFEYKFYNVAVGEGGTSTTTFKRDYKEYRVEFTFTNKKAGKGTIVFKIGEDVIAKLENTSFLNYISTENNGVYFNDNKIFYYAKERYPYGDILVVEMKK